MSHKKTICSVPVGGAALCGSRKLTVTKIEGEVATVELTTKVGETVEIRDPRQRDAPWILDDPGEGDMVNESRVVTISHKIRIGNYRQFRILSFDGEHARIVIIGPEGEV